MSISTLLAEFVGELLSVFMVGGFFDGCPVSTAMALDMNTAL